MESCPAAALSVAVCLATRAESPSVVCAAGTYTEKTFLCNVGF